MPNVVPTPARAAAGAVKLVGSGWVKSLKAARKAGRLRGGLRTRRIRPTRVRVRIRPPRVRIVSARPPELAAAVVAGAGVQYLLDPADGKRRRQVLADQAMAALRRLGRRGAQQARYMEGKAEGAVHE